MKSREDGFSILEVTIAAGILGIIALAMAQLMSNQSKETRALTEKLAALSTKNMAEGLMSNGSICLFETNNPIQTFNSSNASVAASSSMNFAQIHAAPVVGAPVALQAGTQAMPDSSTLFISSIALTNFIGSGTSWTGDWVISFDQTKLVRSLKPITLRVALAVDNSVPTAAKIIGCNTSGGAKPTVTISSYGHPNGNFNSLVAGCHDFCALADTHDCNGCGYSITWNAACPGGKSTWRYIQFKGSSSVNCYDF